MSSPAGPSNGMIRVSQNLAGVSVKRWTDVATGALLGAGLMYLFDRERGLQRRQAVRAQMGRLARQSGHAMASGVRMIRHGQRSVRAGWHALLRHPLLDDEVLARHIRAEIVSLVMDIRGVSVRVERGYVTLAGLVNAPEEERQLIQAVRRLPGVLGVDGAFQRRH
ncbi:MAG: BON domain-containing protein [Acidiferrobacteraceae bacterium]